MIARAFSLWVMAVVMWAACSGIEVYSPRDVYGDMPAALAHVCSLAETMMRLAVGVLAFSFVDRVLWPDVSLMPLARGEGTWRMVSPTVRGAVCAGWLALLAVVVYAFMVG